MNYENECFELCTAPEIQGVKRVTVFSLGASHHAVIVSKTCLSFSSIGTLLWMIFATDLIKRAVDILHAARGGL